jgi:hypothetical protein
MKVIYFNLLTGTGLAQLESGDTLDPAALKRQEHENGQA